MLPPGIWRFNTHAGPCALRRRMAIVRNCCGTASFAAGTRSPEKKSPASDPFDAPDPTFLHVSNVHPDPDGFRASFPPRSVEAGDAGRKRLDGALDVAAHRPDHAERLRREVTDVGSVVRRLGLADGHRQQGSGVVIRCPWHRERAASCALTVGPGGRLRAYCFACHMGGDILSLVAAVHGLHWRRDAAKVVRLAAEKFGLWSLLFEMDRAEAAAGDVSHPPDGDVTCRSPGAASARFGH